MAYGFTKTEQWAFLGFVAVILAGAGVQVWRANESAEGVWTEGGTDWKLVTSIDATKPGITGEIVTEGTAAAGAERTDALSRAADHLERRAAEIAEAGGEALAGSGGSAEAEAGRESLVEQPAAPAAPAGNELTGDPAAELQTAPAETAAGANAPAQDNAQIAPLAALPAAPAPRAPRASAPVASARPSVAPSASDSAAIDINTAGAIELERLPGIGPSKAQAILDHRATIGAFASPEQLGDVKGIGPKTLERLLPYVVAGGSAAGASGGTTMEPEVQAAADLPMAAAPQQALRAPSAAPAPAARASKAQAIEIVDINRAGQEELETLPGVGPTLAQRIIEHRQSRPFRRPEDLMNVKGIGTKTFQKMRSRVAVR